MITVLSGGTGTPKLLRGLRRRLDDAELAVVVNTGEDCWVSGGHLSPDVDTVLYLCAGLLNEQTWWGITGDTFACHEALRSLGEEEVVRIGDRDRAVQLLRGELLRRGLTPHGGHRSSSPSGSGSGSGCCPWPTSRTRPTS